MINEWGIGCAWREWGIPRKPLRITNLGSDIWTLHILYSKLYPHSTTTLCLSASNVLQVTPYCRTFILTLQYSFPDLQRHSSCSRRCLLLFPGQQSFRRFSLVYHRFWMRDGTDHQASYHQAPITKHRITNHRSPSIVAPSTDHQASYHQSPITKRGITKHRSPSIVSPSTLV